MTDDAAHHPFAHTATAQFIAGRIDLLSHVKSQKSIAIEAEFASPNIISMIKRGEAKVPLERIPALAAALETDAAHLFRLAIEDYLPRLAEAFESAFGCPASKNERAILLSPWRGVTRQRDPAPSTKIDSAVKRMLDEVAAGGLDMMR